MAALCRRFGVSRKSGYKWLGRYREDGVAGLADRSRAPCHHPQEVSAELAERCLEVRRAHPTWGPVKVRAVLERRVRQTRWPAASTIGALFDREGLTVKRRLRRRAPPATAPFAACAGANDVWAIDFKGWFSLSGLTCVRKCMWVIVKASRRLESAILPGAARPPSYACGAAVRITSEPRRRVHR